jgi:hypothetical protein
MGKGNRARRAERRWKRAAKEFTIGCATARPAKHEARRLAKLWIVVQREKAKVTA